MFEHVNTMKKLFLGMKLFRTLVEALFLFGFIWTPAGMATAGSEPQFSKRVSDLWLEGRKDEVREIFEARLSRDPNDLVALLLKLDYNVAFLRISDLKETIIQIKDRAATVSTPFFNEKRDLLAANLQIIEQLIPNISDDIVRQERDKGHITGKPLPSLEIIKALESDRIAAQLHERNESSLDEESQSLPPKWWFFMFVGSISVLGFYLVFTLARRKRE